MTGEACAIGLDIGGTDLKAVLLTGEGAELERFTHPTPGKRDALVDCVRESVRSLAASAGAERPMVGLAAPGLAARDGRTVAWMQGRVDAVQGLDWSAALGRPVWVLNDAHAAALGEAWLGAAAGAANVVLLTLGTGVGGGIIADGKLLGGHLGRAGHLGHITVDMDGRPDLVRIPGSLEDAIGDCTIRERSNGRFASTRDLVAAATEGDAGAERVWQRSIRALACGIASLINVVDPEVVVIGGGIASAGDALFEPLRTELDTLEWRPTGARVRILPAKLGPFAGAIGAARHTFRQEQQPWSAHG